MSTFLFPVFSPLGPVELLLLELEDFLISSNNRRKTNVLINSLLPVSQAGTKLGHKTPNQVLHMQGN